MRPSVSQLLSWQPGQLAQAGASLVARAGDLQRSAADLTSVGARLAGVWSGSAAQAATAHHRRRSAEVDELATVVHTAGRALLRAAEAVGSARTSLQSALAAASAAGCTVLDDGTVLPPARPPVPGGLTDEQRSTWQTQADATAAAQAAGAARLAEQVRAALTAAGAADDVSAAALAALQPPRTSPAPQPVSMGLTGGQWGPLALPSCPVTPAAEADEQSRGWLYDAVGGIGSGAWKTGPGMIGDIVGWIPLDAAQAVDDFTDRRYDDLSQWYDADTDSGAYRTADIGTQVGGFLVTGGAAAVRGVPAAVKAAPAAVRATSAALGRVRAAGLAGDAGSVSLDLLTGGLHRIGDVPHWLARVRAGQQWHVDEQARLARLDPGNITELHVQPPPGAALRSRVTHNRVDVYNARSAEIVSMKHTQLASVSPETALGYVKELATKYRPGTVISATRTNPTELHGLQLQGEMVLHVPKQTEPIPQAVLDYAEEMEVLIREAR